MASNRMNVGDLISDEPLDLSMKKTFHEKENFVRGPLVIQPNMPQQTNVVVARLWQTNVVIRSQESTQQQVEKVNEQPIHHKPQTSQQQQVEKVKEEQPAPLKVRTSTLPQQRKTRFRFTRKQINFMEQIFQIKQLLTNSEFLDTARVLNVNELSVRNWFRRRSYKWKKEVECWSHFVKILPAPAQSTVSSSTSPSSSTS